MDKGTHEEGVSDQGALLLPTLRSALYWQYSLSERGAALGVFTATIVSAAVGETAVIMYGAIAVLVIMGVLVAARCAFAYIVFRPFLRGAVAESRIVKNGGEIGVVWRDGRGYTFHLSDCAWTKVQSLRRFIGNRAFPDRPFIIVSLTNATSLTRPFSLLCGYSEQMLTVWEDVLLNSDARLRAEFGENGERLG